jgi:hypothetical protein
VNAVIYVVSSTEVLVLSSDPQTSNTGNNTAFGGSLLKQSGTLSGNPLSGAYIGYNSSLGSTAGTSATSLLRITPSGSSITGTQLKNDGGTFQMQTIGGASGAVNYSVTAAGRMTISGAGAGNHPPIFYLVNPNQSFELDGGGSVGSGFFQSQTSTSASGTYAFGTVDPQDSSIDTGSGVATFASPNINGTSDDNSTGNLSPGGTFTDTFSIDSTGLALISSGCTIGATSTTCQTAIYVISPTRAIVMDVKSTSTNPRIQVADQ